MKKPTKTDTSRVRAKAGSGRVPTDYLASGLAKLSLSETRALEKQRQLDIRAACAGVMRAVPRVMIRQLTGRVQGQLETLARRHDIPIDGATVDLGALLPALLDRLDADPMAGGDGSPALERYRNAKADLAEMDIKVRSGELSDRAETRQGLMGIASIFRNGGEQFERTYGSGARVQFERLIDDAVEEINRMFPGEPYDEG